MKKWKRAICAILCLAMVLALPVMAASPKVADYADLDPDGWYAPAFAFAVENDIMRGVGGPYMAPDRVITRAEFVAILDRLFGTYNPADISGYTDAGAGKWYYDELAMAVQMGTLQGISEMELAPEAPLTREQAITLLARVMALPDGDEAVLDKFSDHAAFSGWAIGSAAAMVEQGRLAGYLDGTVKPEQNITRSETAQLLFRCFPNLVHGKPDWETYGDNLILLPEKAGETVTLSGKQWQDTLFLGVGLADGRVDMTDCDMERLVCWGSHDVYVYSGCDLGQITIARTDGPCIIHWMDGSKSLPDIYITDNADDGCKVVDQFGNTLYPERARPSRPSRSTGSVKTARVTLYLNDGTNKYLTGSLDENGLLKPVDDPVRSGYVFGGWHYEPECETRFQYGQVLEDGAKLYAKWYTTGEWKVVEELNKQANQSMLRISCETDLLATVGEDSIPCLITSGDTNKGPISVEVALADGSGTVIGAIERLEPGETATELKVAKMPDYGTYPVQFICKYLDGVGEAKLNGVLYVAYLWNRGE